MMKTLLSVGLALPWRAAAVVAAMIAFYVVGVYMLSRSYQAGSMVGGVVISDFFARAGAIFLGALALSEPLAGAGVNGVARAPAFSWCSAALCCWAGSGAFRSVREIA